MLLASSSIRVLYTGSLVEKQLTSVHLHACPLSLSLSLTLCLFLLVSVSFSHSLSPSSVSVSFSHSLARVGSDSAPQLLCEPTSAKFRSKVNKIIGLQLRYPTYSARLVLSFLTTTGKVYYTIVHHKSITSLASINTIMARTKALGCD